MTRSTTKKTTTRKAVADPLATVREDTPNAELTDLDRDPACAYCGRDATQRRKDSGRLVCDRHAARVGGEMGKL